MMGAGAWGTALAKVLAEAGGPEAEVKLWARRSDVAEQINATRYNPAYLPGTLLPPGIRATADASEALAGVTTVLLGVPAQTMRSNLERWAPFLADGATPDQPGQGHRAGHAHADEPGDRFGDRRGPDTRRGHLGAEPRQ